MTDSASFHGVHGGYETLIVQLENYQWLKCLYHKDAFELLYLEIYVLFF